MLRFFILDFDDVYDEVEDYENGVQPMAYLISVDDIDEAKRCVDIARERFVITKDFNPAFSDLFEEELEKHEIKFQYLGDINITFGERRNGFIGYIDYWVDVVLV